MGLSCAVALTTYNGEKYLEKQLLSLMNQSHRIDKVYICDDCSTDGTADLVRNFIRENQLSNWDLEVHEHNVGCHKNFRHAILKCDADVIFLCDQDDNWHTDKVGTMLRVFEKYDNVKSLICGFKLIDGDDRVILKKGAVDNPWFHDFNNQVSGESHLYKAELTTVLGHCVGPGCAQAFRRELVEQYIRFDVAWLYHDYKMSLISAMMDGLYFWNEALIDYRRHGNNAVGVPSFFVERRRRYWMIPLYYARILSSDIPYLFSAKRRDEMVFDMSALISVLDTMPLSDHLKADYEDWKAFCENRKKLYSKGRKKNVYRKLQRTAYNRHYKALSYTNDPLENCQMYIKDLCVLLK